MIAEAKYVGADSVRVFVPTASNWTLPYGYMDQIADSGLKFDFVVDPGSTPASNVDAIASFLVAHPGSVALVEGPNEPNNWGVDYAGLSGIAGAQAWQQDFYAAMKANPATAAITIAGVSSYPLVAVASDENNLHLYPNNGNQLSFELAGNVADQARVDPGKTFAITELGWATDPGARQAGGYHVGVDETTQAKLLLNAYLDAITAGATHVGLYDLRDSGYSDFDAHYGLFHYDDTPKAAATALHNVQAILSGGAAADGFEPGSLDYSLTAPEDVRSMLMQRASGEFVLALWREPDVWDEAAAATPIAAAGEGVALRLGASADASIFDPVLGRSSIAATAATRDVAVTVTDHPIFIVLTPSAPGAASAPIELSAPSAPTTDSAPNLIVNGSFEASPAAGAFITLDVGATGIDGWIVTKGSVDAIHDYWQAADGTNSLDMSGNAAGAIAQTFATVAGQQYDVHFSLASNPDDQSVHGLSVSAAGSSQDFYADGAGQRHDAMGWTGETFRFTATGDATTLEFSGLDAGYCGAALDNVSVTLADIHATYSPFVM